MDLRSIKTPLTRINKIINDHLEEIEDGYETVSLEDLLRLKAAAEKDQPVAMMFLLVLNRQLTFLHQTVTDPEAIRIISVFLQTFQSAIETDMLTMMATLKDGLTLAYPGDGSE